MAELFGGLLDGPEAAAPGGDDRGAIAGADVLLVEDDIDITDANEVVWAFATRTHPEHGEVYFPAKPTAALSIYLDEQEQHTYRAGKVIYNCLVADLFPPGKRPVKGTFEHGWPADIQQRVLTNWQA